MRCIQTTALKFPTLTSAKFGREMDVTACVNGNRCSDVTMTDAFNCVFGRRHTTAAPCVTQSAFYGFRTLLACFINSEKHASRRIVSTEQSCHYMYHHVQYSTILRSAHTVYLCVLCGSENKQRLFPYTTLTGWFFCNRNLTLCSPVVTICTTTLTFNIYTFCPHTVFMCFV